MKFSDEDIQKIAHLAKIKVNEKESEKYALELGKIFDLINEINNIDTDNIPPMYNPHDMTLRLREDIVTQSDEREKFQKIAPKTESGLYLVPKVIE